MKTWLRLVSFVMGILLITVAASPSPQGLDFDPSPPGETVKLIFIHHSTGQNWLQDDYGNLGQELGENNYFVSDTNYGWGPNNIGDRTDIPNWTEWFTSANTPTYMNALFDESGQNSSYTRTLSDPGGENEIIMFKSCFPNSNLAGNPDDPPGDHAEMTVSGAKYVYNTILQYFATRPDKLFIVITAPPVQDGTYAANARAFNMWLMFDWLDDYSLNNVAVFDFYNVLTAPAAHHHYNNSTIEHSRVVGINTLYYYNSKNDDHPSAVGSQKATDEFVPLLNIFYHRWKETAPVTRPTLQTPANGEILLHRRPTFDWTDVPGATSYRIMASKDNTFSTLLWKVDTADSTYTPPADLPAGKVIYWRVRAQGNEGWGPWSETWSFTTARPPSIPVLVSPTHKAITKNYTPRLNWNDSTIPSGSAAFDHYQVQVSLNKAFSELLPIDAVTTDSFHTPTTALAANTKYFWRVRSFNVAGEYSSWSSTWVFFTAILPPSNLAPTDGESVPTRKPLLDWDAVEGATGYNLQISTSDSFVTLLVNTSVTADMFTPSTRLPANKIIYWRVRATGTNGPSRWTTASFRTP